MLSEWFIAMRSRNWIFIIASESLFEAKNNNNQHSTNIPYATANQTYKLNLMKTKRAEWKEMKKKSATIYTHHYDHRQCSIDFKSRWNDFAAKQQLTRWERKSRISTNSCKTIETISRWPIFFFRSEFYFSFRFCATHVLIFPFYFIIDQ